jgi:hypothetical protein
MAPVSINHLAIGQIPPVRPALFQDADRAESRAAPRERKVPLVITLPITIVVSLVIWASIGYAVKSLLF